MNGIESRHALESTGSISDPVIEAGKWRARLLSPVTWGVVAATLAASWYLRYRPRLILLIIIVAVIGLAYYWRVKGKALTRRIVKQETRRNSNAQNRELCERARQLERRHAGDLAITLCRFSELKKEIDEEVHRGAELPDSAGDVNQLAEELCFGVADELDRLAHVQGRLARPALQLTEEQTGKLKAMQRDLVQRISDAYESLSETRMNLDAILRPSSLDLPQRKTQLADTVMKLREESEIARRVRERLDQERPSLDGERP